MKILVFGRTGQVASELQLLGNVVALGRDQADLSDPAACASAIRLHAPQAVINAAAYTAVDQAEEEEALATTINGTAPAAMARVCAAMDIPFVHISTDYVFAGNGTQPWSPDNTPAPLSAYGRSKLAGEEGVRAAGGRFAILRTSWVFSSQGKNFVKTMLHLSESRDTLGVVADQIGGPTSARSIASACLSIAQNMMQDTTNCGIYHFSGTPDVSWQEFASTIFAQAGRNVTVTPISTNDYPTRAKRPLNSKLDCSRTKQIFGLSRPDWRQDLKNVLNQLDIHK